MEIKHRISLKTLKNIRCRSEISVIFGVKFILSLAGRKIRPLAGCVVTHYSCPVFRMVCVCTDRGRTRIQPVALGLVPSHNPEFSSGKRGVRIIKPSLLVSYKSRLPSILQPGRPPFSLFRALRGFSCLRVFRTERRCVS